jgi:prepilin-type processing-associated H-X9-DG protein
MANAKYERALARARLALIAPAVDDVTAAYFDGHVEKVLLEAKHREEKSDQELIATLLDAVARKYFSLGLRDGDPEQSADERPSPPIPTES